MVEQIPASPPVRVEIRIGGRIFFCNDVYNPVLDAQDGPGLVFTADLQPTLIDPPPPRPAKRWDDPRDGDKVITFVHSGRRDKEIP